MAIARGLLNRIPFTGIGRLICRVRSQNRMCLNETRLSLRSFSVGKGAFQSVRSTDQNGDATVSSMCRLEWRTAWHSLAFLPARFYLSSPFPQKNNRDQIQRQCTAFNSGMAIDAVVAPFPEAN